MLKIVLIITYLVTYHAEAADIYQQPSDFVNQAFSSSPPDEKFLWLDSILKKKVKKILGHNYKNFRVKYWQKDTKTVWILEQIGKYQPITAGIIIEKGSIKKLRVLIYRETHGWEVKYPFFTNQFYGTGLNKKYNLSKRIDNISGATMSVDAIKNISKLALLFNESVVNDDKGN